MPMNGPTNLPKFSPANTPSIGPFSPAGQPMPTPPAQMPNRGKLPPGTVVYEDGSMRFPADVANSFLGGGSTAPAPTPMVNQAGGANPAPSGPPPLPPNLQAMAAMQPIAAADQSAMAAPLTPPPPIPFRGAQMPGQPPAPPANPNAMQMLDQMKAGLPPEMGGPTPEAPVQLQAPPSATPPPRDQWPGHLQKPAESKPTPMSRLQNRGKSTAPTKGTKR